MLDSSEVFELDFAVGCSRIATMKNVIYLIVRECDDTYYPPHPTKVAFVSKVKAEEYIEKKHAEDEYGTEIYSIREVELI